MTSGNGHHTDKKPSNPLSWLRALIRGKSSDELREALEDYIDHLEGTNDTRDTISTHERLMIANVLKLRDKTVVDVMIPRADVVAVDISISNADLFALLAQKQFSRLPVYADTLDNILGSVHIKDILARLAHNQQIVIKDMIRDVPIVSPALPVLDLILQMRASRRHMAMVVDEYGGIDGLVTIGDVIEAILGEIDDEYSAITTPELNIRADGTIIVDARYEIQQYEDRFGPILNEDEREDIDTFGGLVFSIAGRVPGRGEILCHDESGLTFEVLDADLRSVRRLRIRTISAAPTQPQTAAA